MASVGEDVSGELDEERVVVTLGRVGLVVPGVGAKTVAGSF